MEIVRMNKKRPAGQRLMARHPVPAKRTSEKTFSDSYNTISILISSINRVISK